MSAGAEPATGSTVLPRPAGPDPARGTGRAWSRWATSRAVFPYVVVALLLLATALRISGTSVGIYNEFFYGSVDSTNLIVGEPQPLRSDEWLVNTQLTIAQARDGFGRVNENITSGRDMSLIVDVPYRDWSMVFRPHNLAFFILPLDHAFAFKWWLLASALVLSCYAFAGRMLPGRPLVAAALSLAFALSPFVAWWYQAITIGPLAYGFLVMIVVARIMSAERVRPPWRAQPLGPLPSGAIHAALLAYLFTCFALLIYPPFQIPVILVVLAFTVGVTLDAVLNRSVARRSVLARLALIGSAGALSSGIIAVFLITRWSAVSAVLATVYPGDRSIAAGGFAVDRVLGTFTQPQLQLGLFTDGNQSESSNFLLLVPYLLIPGLVVATVELVRQRRVDWVFASINAVIVLFGLDLFVPAVEPLHRLLLLDNVQPGRLLIGLGFAGMVHTVLLLRKVTDLPANRLLSWLALGYAAACLCVAVLVGEHIRDTVPGFLPDGATVVAYAAAFCMILFLLLARRPRLFAASFLGFSLFSVAGVHPLYVGLDPLADNDVIQAMREVSSPEDTWATLDEVEWQNFALMADRDSLSGIQFYPDLDLWRQVEGAGSDDIYNRFAHVFFTSNPDAPDLSLQFNDRFVVLFSCSDFVTANVDFALVPHELQTGCTVLERTVPYPTRTFYLYRVVPGCEAPSGVTPACRPS